MSLFQVSKDKLEMVPSTTFANEGMLERKDLQRLLRADISPLGSDLLVIAEEFGDWEDSRRFFYRSHYVSNVAEQIRPRHYLRSPKAI